MRIIVTCLLSGLLLAPSFQTAWGQRVLEEFSYDNLRFSGIGADIGVLDVSDLNRTGIGGIRVDAGFFAPRVRLLFGLSYARADYTSRELRRFEDRLRSLVDDPTNDFTIDMGDVTLTTVVADVDLQYLFPTIANTVFFYLGVGGAIHVQNADGDAIRGTFVEDALDSLDPGVNATATLEVGLSRNVRFTTEGRALATTNLTGLSLRFGLMYRVGP